MLNIFIKLLVSKLNNLFVLVALTGFVCTYKIQAEEECLSTNVLCYECDSRYDPNCADPFELSSTSLRDQQHALADAQLAGSIPGDDNSANRQQQQQETNGRATNNTNLMVPKRMPKVVTCHGCCVKITSKTPDGSTYFKRTCTTNLQINYFMVGLVCMKESGDRGKMCFCETDYCNGQPPGILRAPKTILSLLSSSLIVASLLVANRFHRQLIL